MLPDKVIGNSEDMEVVYQPTAHPNHYYGVAGSLEAWKSEVAARQPGIAAWNSAFAFPSPDLS